MAAHLLTSWVQNSRRQLWAPSSPFHRSHAVCQLCSNPWGTLLGETKALSSRHKLDRAQQGCPCCLEGQGLPCPWAWHSSPGTNGWGSLARQAGTQAGPGTGRLWHLARPVTSPTEKADLTSQLPGTAHREGGRLPAKLPVPAWEASVPLRSLCS